MAEARDDTVLLQLANYLRKEIIKNYIAQGHRLTGTFVDTLEVILKHDIIEKIIEGIGEHYAIFLDTGVRSSSIPYNPGGKGGGGKSLYIEGLKRYAELRMGLSGKEALGAAFAIAHTQKKEGMPSLGSYKYSKTGLRTRFLTDALTDSLKHIETEVERWGGRRIEAVINNMVRKYERSI